jgi:cholesterol transport system auxiliary component
MAYSIHPYQISYYAKSAWLGKPSDMLQPMIIQALQNTHRFHAVISPGTGASAQYSLNTNIEELLQDYSRGGAFLRLTVRAQIIRLSSNQVIATQQFVIVQPMLQASPYGGVMAANQATAAMLQQLTRFCLKNI